MGKRIALLTIRLLVSVNLLYAAIFPKFAGCQVRWPCSTRCRKRPTGWYLSLYFGWIRGVRNGGGGSSPNPGDSQIGSAIDG